MKRTLRPLGLALLLVWVLDPGSAYGYRGPDKPDGSRIKKANYLQPDRGGRPGRREGKGRNRRPGREDPRQIAREITKLQEFMKSRMELSADQGKAIDQLFQEHLQVLGQPAAGRKAAEQDPAVAEEIRALRERLAAASEAGNTEAVNELREQLRSLKGGRAPGPEEATSQFLQAVADQLTEEQKPAYQRILKRLKLDRFVEKPGAALRLLMRATMHPDVNLSEEQKKTIRDLSREVFQSASKGAGREGRNPEMLDQVAEELKAKIFAELTEEQRATVERLLQSDQLKRDRKGDRARRGGPRGKGGDRPRRP